MTTYVYAICDQDCHNQVKTISAISQSDAHEKIIERYRDIYDIDEEFSDWHRFIDYLSDYYGVDISPTIQDVETL